jgi:hypothetical protein
VSILYTVFGLVLRSNHDIPGLTPECASDKSPQVEIRLGVLPRALDTVPPGPEELVYASSHLAESGESALRIWKIANGALLRLDYFDGVRFWLDSNATSIWAVWPSALSLEDVATYLLGPVLGLLLRLRGVPCLHASAVAFGGRAVAFVGAEGTGKSTTAAALASRGHAVISDDIVALLDRDASFSVLPAYPYLSLWPESVKMLYGPGKNLPAFSPSYEKRQLFLAENRLKFQEAPVSLGAVFLLGHRVANTTAPFVETLAAPEALVALIANSYATNLLDKNMRSREFELLGRLVTAIPNLRLRPHDDGSRMGLLCDLIQAQCQKWGLID